MTYMDAVLSTPLGIIPNRITSLHVKNISAIVMAWGIAAGFTAPVHAQSPVPVINLGPSLTPAPNILSSGAPVVISSQLLGMSQLTGNSQSPGSSQLLWNSQLLSTSTSLLPMPQNFLQSLVALNVSYNQSTTVTFLSTNAPIVQESVPLIPPAPSMGSLDVAGDNAPGIGRAPMIGFAPPVGFTLPIGLIPPLSQIPFRKTPPQHKSTIVTEDEGLSLTVHETAVDVIGRGLLYSNPIFPHILGGTPSRPGIYFYPWGYPFPYDNPGLSPTSNQLGVAVQNDELGISVGSETSTAILPKPSVPASQVPNNYEFDPVRGTITFLQRDKTVKPTGP